jgi:hypothetical protein
MGKRFVVVTTAHKGVFGGYLNGSDDTSKTIELTDAQMCVYWSQPTKGVLGLASQGPQPGSRVGPPVPRIVLQEVTAVMDANPEAERAWQNQTWS